MLTLVAKHRTSVTGVHEGCIQCVNNAALLTGQHSVPGGMCNGLDTHNTLTNGSHSPA
jgi:hypothetical protein